MAVSPSRDRLADPRPQPEPCSLTAPSVDVALPGPSPIFWPLHAIAIADAAIVPKMKIFVITVLLNMDILHKSLNNRFDIHNNIRLRLAAVTGKSLIDTDYKPSAAVYGLNYT